MLLLCYYLPFHHLTSLTREDVEFPSYGFGPLKAFTLKEEMDKVLLKDALEILSDSEFVLYSRLFLAEKESKLKTGYRSFFTQRISHAHQL